MSGRGQTNRRGLGAYGWLCLLGAAAAGLGGGCELEERLNPVSAPGPDAGSDAGQGGQGGSGGALPVRRTVEQRNPFGNVAAARNLLWDGDFEWSLPFPEQYGWLAGTPSQITGDMPVIVVGPECASGLKCAQLGVNRALLGLGVSSQGHELSASVWIKPAEPSCEGAIDVMHFTESPSEPEVSLAPESAQPDERGYCHFAAVVPERARASYLYVANRSGGELLVDDAVLLPLEAERRAPRVAAAVPERLVAAAKELRPAIRRALLPHDPPPDPVREAFASKWRRGR